MSRFPTYFHNFTLTFSVLGDKKNLTGMQNSANSKNEDKSIQIF